MIDSVETGDQLASSRLPMNGQQNWVVLLMVAILALLPFGRLAEVPIIVLMVWGLVLLLRDYKSLTALAGFKPLNMAFAAYFAVILISAIDSYWPQKSIIIALASIRFYLIGLVVIYYANSMMLQQLMKWVVVLMVVWSVDALIQSMLGYNLLGLESYQGRLTGVFGANVKLGPVLALLLPMVMIHSCRVQTIWRWIMVALLLAVILLSGTRSAWLMMVFTMVMFWWHHVKGRRWLLLLKVMLLSGLAMTLLLFVSNDFQQRVDRTLKLFSTDTQAIDFALADRLPIWSTAINMYVDHPFNGVGARAFRQVYGDYADAGDIWVAQQGGGLHAHHWVLELLAETGTIGLLLILWMMAMLTRFVYQKFQNELVWPYGVALMAAMLPVVSLYSLFSSFWAICLWWLIIMLIAGSQQNE